MSEHLHIIAFDVPYPPSYGGVIDVYFKIKALHEQGVKVHLHCFEYGRAIAHQLNEICETVLYYKRKQNILYLFRSLPYIALTRSSDELVGNLMKDDYPILFEGLHCCVHLSDRRLSGRMKIVRTHNIEHDYYDNLAKVEPKLFRRLYFASEARKLKRFEKILHKAEHIIAISSADRNYLRSVYRNAIEVPAFHPDERTAISPGKGTFAFYHGNLEIGENIEAAMFLINRVFNDLSFPLIIAGKNPPAHLIELASRFPNIQLKANISTEEIYTLVHEAQMNVLPTFQSTGIKLKLLTSLFKGRHCIVNSPMAKDTGLESLCIICDSAEDFKKEIIRMQDVPFSPEDILDRDKVLLGKFSNTVNAGKIIELIQKAVIGNR